MGFEGSRPVEKPRPGQPGYSEYLNAQRIKDVKKQDEEEQKRLNYYSDILDELKNEIDQFMNDFQKKYVDISPELITLITSIKNLFIKYIRANDLSTINIKLIQLIETNRNSEKPKIKEFCTGLIAVRNSVLSGTYGKLE